MTDVDFVQNHHKNRVYRDSAFGFPVMIGQSQSDAPPVPPLPPPTPTRVKPQRRVSRRSSVLKNHLDESIASFDNDEDCNGEQGISLLKYDGNNEKTTNRQRGDKILNYKEVAMKRRGRSLKNNVSKNIGRQHRSRSKSSRGCYDSSDLSSTISGVTTTSRSSTGRRGRRSRSKSIPRVADDPEKESKGSSALKRSDRRTNKTNTRTHNITSRSKSRSQEPGNFPSGNEGNEQRPKISLSATSTPRRSSKKTTYLTNADQKRINGVEPKQVLESKNRRSNIKDSLAHILNSSDNSNADTMPLLLTKRGARNEQIHPRRSASMPTSSCSNGNTSINSVSNPCRSTSMPLSSCLGVKNCIKGVVNRSTTSSAPVAIQRTMSTGYGRTPKTKKNRIRRPSNCLRSNPLLSGGISFHDAMLGTWKWKEALQKLHDGDGTLTKETLMKIFDNIDLDGDGSGDIDVSELIFGLQKAGLNMSTYEMNTLFKAADENGDDIISRAEWESLANKILYVL